MPQLMNSAGTDFCRTPYPGAGGRAGPRGRQFADSYEGFHQAPRIGGRDRLLQMATEPIPTKKCSGWSSRLASTISL